MGVTLERVQNKFACIIGELCSEPLVLSQFAVWVDLRIAEYKTNGTISLDCSGCSPNPSWMKGVKNHPQRGGSTSVDTGQGAHHRRGSYATSPAESPLYNDRVQPPDLSPRHSQNSNSQHAFPTRLSPDIVVIKSEPDTDQQGSCSLGRKRHSDSADFQSDYYSPAKSRRLGNTSSTLSSAAQESSSNQSLMSIINAENDSVVLETVDTSNTDIFKSTMETMQEELDKAQGLSSSNATFSSLQPTATSTCSSPSQSAWPTQYSSNQSSQGSSSQTDLTSSQWGHPGRSRLPFMPTDDNDARMKDRILMKTAKSISAIRHELAALRVLERWLSCSVVRETRKVEDIPPVELDNYLERFYQTVRKPSGEDYDPYYLKVLRSCLERYLKDHGYPVDTVRSPEFRKSQKSFKIRVQRAKHSPQMGFVDNQTSVP